MLEVGDTAIDFTLPNVDGKPVSLFAQLAKASPLFLVFYKYDCPTCQFTFRYLPRIAKAVGEAHFLAVAQDPLKTTREFSTKYGVSFPTLIDEHPYKVSAPYGFDFVPTVFVVEKDKKISHVAEGFDKKFLEDFAQRVSHVEAFQPQEQVPLLKPG